MKRCGAAAGSGAPSKRKLALRKPAMSWRTSSPRGEGSRPSSTASAICAWIVPNIPATGPSTPALAQVATLSGRSGNTARSEGAPPQKPPAWPASPTTAAETSGRPISRHRSDRV